MCRLGIEYWRLGIQLSELFWQTLVIRTMLRIAPLPVHLAHAFYLWKRATPWERQQPVGLGLSFGGEQWNIKI